MVIVVVFGIKNEQYAQRVICPKNEKKQNKTKQNKTKKKQKKTKRLFHQRFTNVDARGNYLPQYPL